MATEKPLRGATAMEVVPLEMYDSARAKIAANLHWLFAKAFSKDDIPTDLHDPFYTDQYEQEHMKPPIIHLLLSAELYCRVCGPLFQPEQSLHSHQCVIQALSRKGIFVMEDPTTMVSEHDLTSAPIKMSSHIHLIDALMLAYTVEMMSIDKVVSAEVPFDVEEAMIFWIKQVNTHLREISQKELKMKQQFLESPGQQKSPSKWFWKLLPARYRKDHLSGRAQQHFPVLENLSNFVCTGTALLAVVHFYCPELIRIEDICLKEAPSIADSLYNMQLLKDFSNEFLNKSFYLETEDTLYSPPVLKINIMQFIAELFWIFEVVKPEFVQPRDIPQIKDVRFLMRPRRSQSFCSLSSSSTFLPSPNSCHSIATAKSPEISSQRGSHLSVLPRRQKEQNIVEDENQEQRNRSISGCGTQRTKLAWLGKRQRPLSQTVPYALHFPLEEDAESSSLAPNPSHRSPHNLQDYIRFEDKEEEIVEEELVEIIDPTTLPRPQNPSASRVRNTQVFDTDHSINTFYLEPLMPAVTKPAKEKSVYLNKEEEYGDSIRLTKHTPHTQQMQHTRHTQHTQHSQHIQHIQHTAHAAHSPHRGLTHGSTGSGQSDGFFLHLSEGPHSSVSSLEAGNDSDSDIENLTEDNDELEVMGDTRDQGRCYLKGQGTFGEGESEKLGEDLKLREWPDKDVSVCSSPCLSSKSWSSSTSLCTGVKLTSFAEKKLLKLGLRDGFSSTSSSPKTTPDDSESALCPPWQLSVPSELLELHMKLEERRHAIEFQKKKMESLSAQQRLKLGKAAFLNVVKKEAGRSDTLPLPLKHQHTERQAAHRSEVTTHRDDSCLEALRVKARHTESAQMFSDNKLSECSRSLGVLNEAIVSIQQQMNQLSLQQHMLIQHSTVSPAESTQPQSDISTTPHTVSAPSTKSKAFVVNFENIGDSSESKYDNNPLPSLCTPKFSSCQYNSSRQKRNKQKKEEDLKNQNSEPSTVRNITFSVCDDTDQHSVQENASSLPAQPQAAVDSINTAVNRDEHCDDSEAAAEGTRVKAQLFEVDLSEIKEPLELSGEHNVLGYFFKDNDVNEMAKRRAAFLLKQQRKSEEAKLRKQQQEAESELKRDEARRKAEEERIRKDEEKARRELIKQEYLRRKQHILLEEQSLVKPLPRTRSRKNRPKSVHRERGSTTPDLSLGGSTLSLATEGDSVVSGGSQRAESVCSVESFPVLSRASSRNMERDWENASIASSITSTEYTGPKLFKEPSSKSNKPIIINAIAHCCLAGKVNETQKNAILEELDKCDSNYLFILFRDAGCQFRAVYSYSPDTEEITKITGTGPRAITHKMVDKIYKYNSDRKQFTVIPAKSVSVSVDALTIHNHLWQIRRPCSARRK